MKLIETRNVFLKKLDNDFEKSLDDQSSNEPIEFMDDDLIYNDEFVGNKPTMDQFGNKPTNEQVNHK